MAAFHFELVSPEKLLFSGEVESVVVPGAEGAFTVLKDHAPVMSTLKPGLVEVSQGAGKAQRLFVRGGFADVAAGAAASYDYEPEQGDILADLLPRNISVQILRALLENQASFYGSQMSAMLLKQGVKPDELKWTGFDEWAKDKKQITRDEAADFLKKNAVPLEERALGEIHKFPPKEIQEKYLKNYEDAKNKFWQTKYGDPNYEQAAREFKQAEDNMRDNVPGWGISKSGVTNKYEQYTLPGGENYRELLLKQPVPDRQGAFARGESAPTYQSGHWDDPNVLAHLRMADRVDPQGRRVLHLDEIQSDWGQAGRERGFVGSDAHKAYLAHADALKAAEQESANLMRLASQRLGRINFTYEEARRVVPELDAASRRQSDLYFSGPSKPDVVPAAPFVESTPKWTDLALKRALVEAVRGGHDVLAWTPGAEQAARYDLSKQIDKITYRHNPDGTVSFAPYKGDSLLSNAVMENVHPDKLSEALGRDVAEKIIGKHGIDDSGVGTISGLDLQTGGEGMKGYYDKIVPNQLQTLAKGLDPEARISTIDMPVGERTVPMQSLEITPMMREKVKQGLPMFADGGEVAEKSKFDGEHVLKHFKNLHPEPIDNPKMTDWVNRTNWVLSHVAPENIPSMDDDVYYDKEPFGRVMDIDEGWVNRLAGMMKHGHEPAPIVMGPGKSIIDGNHRAQAAKMIGRSIPAYIPEDSGELVDNPRPSNEGSRPVSDVPVATGSTTPNDNKNLKKKRIL